MTKNLLKASLWGILTLSALQSCRAEDGLVQKQQEKDMRFSVFVQKEGKTINYSDGFAYLMTRYDKIHKTNFSGTNNSTVSDNLITSTNKNLPVDQSNGAYVETKVHSVIFTADNGDKWVIYPRVQGTKVVELVVGLLTEKETYVRFSSYGVQSSLFQDYGQAFQDGFNRYQAQIKSLKLSAGINYIAETQIEGVTVPGRTKPSDPKSNDNPPDPGLGNGGQCGAYLQCDYMDGSGGGGSGTGSDEVYQDPDPCTSMKTQKESTNFKNNITDLKGKTGLKKETGYTQSGATGEYTYQDNASATETANSLRLPDAKQNNVKSYSHTHVDDYTYTDSDGNEIIRTGIKMFSPADVSYLMDMLQNAKDRGINFSDVSGTMVTSLGTYTIRFTGNEYQLKSFTDTQIAGFTEPYKTFMTNNSNLSLEQKFLQFIDSKMNVKGMQLFKLNDDSTTTKTQLNSDKSSVTASNCP
ncbi:hypothetical protein VO54_02021 [Elizabethkingia miricola]|nr:hypothetical protein VO54_02021 [Elizabethkingia miricola]